MLLASLFLGAPLYPQEADPAGENQKGGAENRYKDYQITAGYFTDLRPIASTGILLNKLGYDLYFNALSPRLPKSAAKIIEPIWTTLVTFHLTLWPHEIGHWCRANQAGGDFIMTQYRFPIPVMEMVIPENVRPEQLTLMSSGGFEINSLMRRQTEYDFYLHGYRRPEDLAHSFIQTIFFSMYSLLFTPAKPQEAETWINTYGDPVDYTKIVYEHYSGRPAIASDGKPDADLVELYKEIVRANIAAVLLDPMLYQSASGFIADMKNPALKSPWLLGGEKFRWMYSLQFNPGALGYEIYFTNHIRIMEKYIAINIRYGRPFKNYGLGVFFPQIITRNRFSLGASLDLYEQDLYGNGFGVTLMPAYRLGERHKVSLEVAYKSEGYILGRKLEEGAEVLLHTFLRF